MFRRPSFLSLTERELREIVVRHMIVANTMEEKTPKPSQERPINRTRSTARKGPLACAIIRDHWIGMLEIDNHGNPVIHKLPK